VSYEYDGAWVGESGVTARSFRVVVEAQNVSNGVIQVFGLVEQGLAMKGGEVFVEIYSEEV